MPANALTADQATHFIRFLEARAKTSKRSTHRDAVACLLGLHALRISEVCNLRTTDWNRSTRMLHVATLKGGPAADIPVRPSVALHLDRLQCDARRRRLRWLMTTSTGKRLSPRNLRRTFHAWSREALGTRFRFHDLRHTTARQMEERGANVFTIQVQLRHAKLQNTVLYLQRKERILDWLPQ